jgi:hydroxymethylpyrimidine pyrophosphatase-like HAD family hydrolase
VRCAYIDMDGTLLGPGGGLFAGPDGEVSILGARAIEACLRSDVEVVVMSGRRRDVAIEDARLFGQGCCIFEIGAGVVMEGETYWLTGAWQPGNGRTIHTQIAETGALQFLLEEYSGCLEEHSPWHVNREVSHLLRGLVDTKEANALLDEHGFEGLELTDNGAVRRRSPALADLPRVHAYHLRPRGVSKAGAVAAHQRMRGYEPAECVAVGDSREDLGVARTVGAFWLVANAIERDPHLEEVLACHPNARLCEEAHGAGVYEAIVRTLAERGA